jgi:hypothetical protein
MAALKAFSSLAISTAVLLMSSPAIAVITPESNCEYIRRNINSRLPKGINLERSAITEVSINGKSSRECVMYGNETAIQYAWQDYRTIPEKGLVLPNGTFTIDGRTYREELYYGWNKSYIPLEGARAIVILTDSASARY